MATRTTPGRHVSDAAAFLTRLPYLPAAGGAGAPAFALVGAALGAGAAIPALLLADRAPLLGAALALIVLHGASGGLHLDGLADTTDALAAPDARRADLARRDPAVGAVGAAAVALVLLADAGALMALPIAGVMAVLVVAGAVSRSVPVVGALFAGPSAGGLGAWWAASVRWTDAGACCLTSLAVALALPGGRVASVVAGLGAGTATLILLRRSRLGVNGDGYGAAVEVGFLAALIGGLVA